MRFYLKVLLRQMANGIGLKIENVDQYSPKTQLVFVYQHNMTVSKIPYFLLRPPHTFNTSNLP